MNGKRSSSCCSWSAAQAWTTGPASRQYPLISLKIPVDGLFLGVSRVRNLV